jgi:hypothetical protein
MNCLCTFSLIARWQKALYVVLCRSIHFYNNYLQYMAVLLRPWSRYVLLHDSVITFPIFFSASCICRALNWEFFLCYFNLYFLCWNMENYFATGSSSAHSQTLSHHWVIITRAPAAHCWPTRWQWEPALAGKLWYSFFLCWDIQYNQVMSFCMIANLSLKAICRLVRYEGSIDGLLTVSFA